MNRFTQHAATRRLFTNWDMHMRHVCVWARYANIQNKTRYLIPSQDFNINSLEVVKMLNDSSLEFYHIISWPRCLITSPPEGFVLYYYFVLWTCGGEWLSSYSSIELKFNASHFALYLVIPSYTFSQSLKRSNTSLRMTC